MKYPVHNQTGEKVKEVELNSKIFEVPINEELVHQVVVAQDANRRQVIAHTKTRSEVRGGGRKPHRQKGTGRARAGSTRSPLWRSGGVTFGPRSDRNFSKGVNKKMKRKALFIGLSDKAESQELVLLEDLQLAEGKTKKFVELMSKLFEKINGPDYKANFKTLVVTPTTDDNLILSSRNLRKVKVIRADSLNVKDVIGFDKLVMPVQSLSIIEETYL